MEVLNSGGRSVEKHLPLVPGSEFDYWHCHHPTNPPPPKKGVNSRVLLRTDWRGARERFSLLLKPKDQSSDPASHACLQTSHEESGARRITGTCWLPTKWNFRFNGALASKGIRQKRVTEEEAKAALGSEHACRQACRNIHMYIYHTNIYHTLTNAYTQRHTKRINQTNPIFKVIESLHSILPIGTGGKIVRLRAWYSTQTCPKARGSDYVKMDALDAAL